MSDPLYLAKSEDGFPALLPQMANRHGLITGATGTGKTVTLQSMAERLSYAGVPVFMADVKGDLSGMGAAGTLNPKLEKRIKEAAFKNIDVKGERARSEGRGGGATNDLGHWLRSTPPRCYLFLACRVVDDNDLRKAASFAGRGPGSSHFYCRRRRNQRHGFVGSFVHVFRCARIFRRACGPGRH